MSNINFPKREIIVIPFSEVNLWLHHIFVFNVEKKHAGGSGPKTLRQLHVEDDDEERFQADLKKAVRQSLGM